MYKKFAVIGKPVSHSLSPYLFKQYINDFDGDYSYSRILCDNVEEAWEIIGAFDLSGINITAPFKRDILRYCDIKSGDVNTLNVANTILVKDKIYAYNTDVYGVQKAIERHIDKDAKVLVIGAGGAAKAALKALQNLNVRHIYIYNRTEDKARALADKMNVGLLDDDVRDAFIFDFIINTIPVEASILSKIKLANEGAILDAGYKNKVLKPFSEDISWQYIDGSEWLKAQGYRAYQLMTGKASKLKLRIDDKLIHKHYAKSKIIAFVGMMATGKSKLARILAEKLSWRYVDLDAEVEKLAGESIAAIFKNKGEEYFRDLESKMLRRFLNEENIVLATGGGIVLSDENISLLKERAWNILLYSSPEVSASRINTEKRPLLKGKNKLELLTDIFEKRRDRYFKVADIVVNRNDFIKDKVANIDKTIRLIYEDYSATFLV